MPVPGAPTRGLLPAAATAAPNAPSAAGVGGSRVVGAASPGPKTKAAPPPGAAVSSPGAPTSTPSPAATTAAPKASPAAGVPGFRRTRSNWPNVELDAPTT